MHAWGLRLRGVRRVLALAHSPVLPSAMLNDVGTPVAIISQLNALPACAPVNASLAASRLAMHDSGPGWIATPSLYDSSIHDSTPVYPGALSSLLARLGSSRVRICEGADSISDETIVDSPNIGWRLQFEADRVRFARITRQANKPNLCWYSGRFYGQFAGSKLPQSSTS
jgi:hypothetical protein